MKTIKQKLIFLGVLIIGSLFVIHGLRLSSFIYPIIWIFIPILIYSLFPKIKSLLTKIIFVTFLIVYGLIFSFFLLQFVLCGYGPTQDEYVNKGNANLKIVGRDFSCFGTTGDLVLYKQFSISNDIKVEIYYKTFVDYKDINIDTASWKLIQKY
jgi:hypothetical protein